MNTRLSKALVSVATIACIFACDRPDAPSASGDKPTPAGLTPNEEPDAGDAGASEDVDGGDPDAGGSDAGALDAGSQDAGEDAGQLCPPFYRPNAGGCEAEVSVCLTGTAAAIRGDTLYAGTGQQPVFQVFVSEPSGCHPTAVSLTIDPILADGGAQSDAGDTHLIASATTDDAGTHYDLPWSTTDVPEGAYQARAQLVFGDAGFASNPVGLLVDRTPPSISLDLRFDLDAGVQPRDFRATAIAVGADDGGSGEVTIALTGTGVVVLPPFKGITTRVPARAKLPMELPVIERGQTILATPIHAGDVPYDAWSTAQDNWSIDIQATATDLVGNVASTTLTVPVTRGLWDALTIETSGPFSIGPQGQVFVNHGLSLDALGTDGSLQSRTLIEPAMGGSAMLSTGAPATLVSRTVPQGETFVPSLGHHVPFVSYGQVSSVGVSDTFSPITGNTTLALAVSAGRGLIYVLGNDCGLRAFDAVTGANDTPAGNINPFVPACAGVQVALGKDHLLGASAGIELTYALIPLNGVWSAGLSGARGAAPVFLGDLAVFDLGGDLELFDPMTGPNNDSIEVGTADASKVVTSSQGDVFVLETDGMLTKLSSAGVKAWQRQLGVGLTAPGLSIGEGADLIYAVDGSGVVSAFDRGGTLRWRSPAQEVAGDLLIDHCTGHAYGSAYGVAAAVAVDSLGQDMGEGAWPVGGHDVFQTYDAEGSADVNCGEHW